MSSQVQDPSASTLPAKPPFFILGCVRSGTTLLRDVIASHPLLFCPNETHFFRYADPFGTRGYITPLLNAKIFQKHRALDNITEDQFRHEILFQSKSRGELMAKYGAAYLKAQNAPPNARWFDKTPQNVYGILLIAHYFPVAQFVHIIRNPLNVISSLRTSNIMKVNEIVGAASYWAESIAILRTVKPILGDRLLEVNYEDFTRRPMDNLKRIFDFINEDPSRMNYEFARIRSEKNNYRSVLPPEDVHIAREICGDLARDYGFDL